MPTTTRPWLCVLFALCAGHGCSSEDAQSGPDGGPSAADANADVDPPDGGCVQAGNCDAGQSLADATPIPEDHAPVAGIDAYSVDEDDMLTVDALGGVLANDTDADGDALTAVLDSGTADGVLTLDDDGSFTYAPSPDFNGADSFDYHASDGALSSTTVTVTITVGPLNDAPIADHDAYSMDENSVLTVGAASGVLANDTDVDLDTLTAVLDSGPANGGLSLDADGAFTYTPNADFIGSDSFDYHASDGTSDSAIVTVTLEVQLVDLVWATSAGGSSRDIGDGVAVLADGSALVTGHFINSMTLGAGEPDETTLSSAGDADAFLARYNPDGTLAWATSAGGSLNDIGRGVAVFSDGSAVITGYFQGTATFGAGEANETSLSFLGFEDVFVARYNPDGTLAWATGGGGSIDSGMDVAARPDGTVLVTGYFRSSAVFGTGELNETTLTSAGVSDVFVAQYNSDGSLAWARRAGGSSSDSGTGIAALADGSVLVTGGVKGVATFETSDGPDLELTADGPERDIFLARYDSSGTLVWATLAGGPSPDSGRSVDVLSDGSALVTGYFIDSAVFGAGEAEEIALTSAGSFEIFVARYNADGTLAWVTTAGGSSTDIAEGIAALADGSTVVTGRFKGTATFGAGETDETDLVSTAGFEDVFVARYNPDGTLASVTSAGGATPGLESGKGVAVLADGTALVTGYFQGTATFGEGEGHETDLVSAGDDDMFLARYAP